MAKIKFSSKKKNGKKIKVAFWFSISKYQETNIFYTRSNKMKVNKNSIIYMKMDNQRFKETMMQ